MANLDISITKNGTTILATKGTKNNEDINLNVDVQPNVGTITKTYTTNGEYTLTPSTGWYYSQVNITVNTPMYITSASVAALPTETTENMVALITGE